MVISPTGPAGGVGGIGPLPWPREIQNALKELRDILQMVHNNLRDLQVCKNIDKERTILADLSAALAKLELNMRTVEDHQAKCSQDQQNQLQGLLNSITQAKADETRIHPDDIEKILTTIQTMTA